MSKKLKGQLEEPTFFLKVLFSYIDERRKLNLVRYNKNEQKNLNISLINYKFYVGKYLALEEERKVKEYDGFKDELIFEGGYSNGKKNGIIKEYDINGKVEFEGEYLNGIRNGKFKKYYNDGNL